MTYSGKELQAYLNSGLTLVGQDDEGALMWAGTPIQWRVWEALMK